ncbi:MAG: hypothetical protein A2W86_01145 [Bacteroidetes bacterium GWD2_45_23]|nr:MAG: hypothetical protein A2W87_11070 [Bacteroidetes bacterium GWC2_46_850]OFX74275.1 MAG: hypothetical protein A2071_04005 [Bacteroidetes bacterium GWC1_47_7]OFX84097.1 MAG: hypothetical protein A2W86_01145 [Bacteroidetes bacterium GWD2_45_23]
MRKTLLFILSILFIVTSCNQTSGNPDPDWADDVGARYAPEETDVWNVTDWGAIADGKTLNTISIQKAIDACFKAGGGIVTFEPGEYLTGSIYLKDGVHLILPEGVTILGSQHIEDYPDIPTRVAGIEMVWPSALINVIGQKNVKISGKGAVDGQGKPFWDNYWEMRKRYEAEGLRWIVDYDCKRPRTLLVSESEDVTVKDITLKRAGFWTIHLLYSSYCTVDGVIIRNNIGGHGPSTDGIDIDSSSHILVENCDIDCNDDNFCLKAGRDADGLRVNRPTEYIVIRNCISRAGGGLFTIGSETSGGIRYVLAHDLKAEGTTVGLRFKSAMNRGGTTSHIYLRDIEMKNVGTVIEATMNWNPAYSYSELPEKYAGTELPDHWKKMLEKIEPAEKGIPYFNDIHFSGITATNAKRAFNVSGSERSSMENFYLKDINIDAEKGGSIKLAKNWEVENATIKTSDNNPVDITESENVSIPFSKDVFIFSYFTGNGADGLHLAYSKDGLKWETLHNGQSFLKPRVGKDSLMRDPSIVQDDRGTFHMVWTTGWWDQHIGYASSNDLINWSKQRSIPVMVHEPGTKNSWAPELYYDKESGLFYIIWASTVPGKFPETPTSESEKGLNHRQYYVTTKDFESFSETKLFFDPGFSVIDAAIIKKNDRYWMIVKNENSAPPEKNLRIVFTNDLKKGFPTEVSGNISGEQWAEGPSPIQIGEYVYVYFDKYRDKRYGAIRSKDGKMWEDVSDQIEFPSGTRHGTAFRITSEEFESIKRVEI